MPRLTLPRVLLIIASLGTAVVLQSAVLRASGFRSPPISCLSSSSLSPSSPDQRLVQ